MDPRRLLRVGGPTWELARAFLLLAYLAANASSAGTADRLSAPWLAAVGAAGLVLPAAFLFFAIDPQRHAAFLPLLIMGKVFEAGTVVLLFVTGTLGSGSLAPLQTGLPFPREVPEAGLFVVALLLDIGVLVGLVRLRSRSSPSE
jgi:hypothetical protein